jgi:hypothetical protein
MNAKYDHAVLAPSIERRIMPHTPETTMKKIDIITGKRWSISKRNIISVRATPTTEGRSRDTISAANQRELLRCAG